MRRLFGASAEALIIVILVFGLLAVPVLAAKGGNGGGGKPGGGDSGGTGTISLVLMDSTDGVAHYGQRVTFDVATTATDSPYVQLQCNNAGTLVLEAYQGFFPTAMGNQWFHLGPTTLWQGGEADCTANLVKYTRKGWQQLGSTAFHVEP